MIISYKYKYLFVELPHTASTAISQELCENYAGEPILHKHALRSEFLKTANDDEKGFFTFAGIRNPLDVIVTVYSKQKTNHQNFYTDPKHWKKNGGHISNAVLRKYRFINDNKADFATYFMKFYKLPFSGWGSSTSKEFDYIIRFENLQEDFAQLLSLLSIAQIRSLPTVNKTKERKSDFWSYYSPHTRKRIQWVFGPYLHMWNYDFPPEWGLNHVPWLSQGLFTILRFVKNYGSSIVGGGLRS